MSDLEALPASGFEGETEARLEAAPRTKDNGLQSLVWGCLFALMVGFVGLGVIVAFLPTLGGPSPIRDTEFAAQTLEQATILFRAEHPNVCPSARQLVEGEYIDSTRSSDSWGLPFRMVCDGRDVRVYSAGPDGAFDTADDVNR